MAWGDGCVRLTTRSIASWGNKSLTVGNGRRDGGLGGRTGDVIEKLARGWNSTPHVLICTKSA